MGHTLSKMSSVQGYLQQLAVAAAALLPGTSLQARKEEQLLSILNNSVISEKILSHLTVRDMKAASQVNSTFCRMVRGSLGFREKVILVVSKDAVALEEVLENTRLCCDEGVVDLSASLRTVQLLSEMTWELIIRTESKTNFWWRMERLAKLLKYSPELKLKTLYVDIRELEEFSKVVSDLVEFLDLMTSTECLYISDCRLKEVNQDIASRNWLLINYDPVARMHLKPTSASSRSQKLTSFVCHIFDCKYSHPVALEVIEEILKRHKETLQVFWCNYKIWTLDFMKTIKMPLLEVLYAKVSPEDEEVFIGFLEGLESLRDLEIVVNGKLSKSLVAAIEKRSSKLTRLHIHAKNFCEIRTIGDWSFLRSMELLKDFGIKVWGKESYDEVELIVMSSLPPKQLRDLSVGGTWPAWKDDGNLELLNASHHLWMSLWKGFRCLRKLNLACCWNSVDDDFVQMILRECKVLQELLMEKFPQLTMKGFTGINNESECNGISVKDHQNLMHLSIKCCSMIQPNDLVSTDAFRNLKSLNYIPTGDPPAPMPDDVVVLLILKNPRLEKIGVPLKSDDSAKRIKENVDAYNHPLRKVINRIS